jgi:broad specificity phosphatase PhoE
VEPKAQETALLISQYLGVPFEIYEGLHEHDRSQVGFLGKEEFQRAIASFFERPEELILGQETAAQALARFDKAILNLLSKYPDGNLAVVTHGTVITLFTAFHAGVAPFPFWQKLGLPSLTILTAPKIELESVVENII